MCPITWPRSCIEAGASLNVFQNGWSPLPRKPITQSMSILWRTTQSTLYCQNSVTAFSFASESAGGVVLRTCVQ
jgi:hypothetical protein